MQAYSSDQWKEAGVGAGDDTAPVPFVPAVAAAEIVVAAPVAASAAPAVLMVAPAPAPTDAGKDEEIRRLKAEVAALRAANLRGAAAHEALIAKLVPYWPPRDWVDRDPLSQAIGGILHQETTTMIQHLLDAANSNPPGSAATFASPRLLVDRVDRIENPALWRRFRETQIQRRAQCERVLGRNVLPPVLAPGVAFLPTASTSERVAYLPELQAWLRAAALDATSAEVLLFTTVPSHAVVPIAQTGFSTNFANAESPLGAAIYFAATTCFDQFATLDDTGAGFVLVCRVVLGHALIVSAGNPFSNRGQRLPPPLDPRLPAGDRFHSIVDLRGAPNHNYAVYDGSQVYPAYVARYRRG